MKTGDSLRTTNVIRSQKTGVLLPRRGTFVRDIENLGRTLILVDFGSAGKEYLFPDEVLPETQDSNFCADKQDDLRSFQSGFEHCALWCAVNRGENKVRFREINLDLNRDEIKGGQAMKVASIAPSLSRQNQFVRYKLAWLMLPGGHWRVPSSDGIFRNCRHGVQPLWFSSA